MAKPKSGHELESTEIGYRVMKMRFLRQMGLCHRRLVKETRAKSDCTRVGARPSVYGLVDEIRYRYQMRKVSNGRYYPPLTLGDAPRDLSVSDTEKSCGEVKVG